MFAHVSFFPHVHSMDVIAIVGIVGILLTIAAVAALNRRAK